MARSPRPTDEDRIAALQIVLRGMASGVDVYDLVAELVPLHPRHDTFPGEVFFELGADALEVGGVDRTDPIE